MSKYQALIDALAYAKFTGGTGITASVADLDSIFDDLEMARNALAVMLKATEIEDIPDSELQQAMSDPEAEEIVKFQASAVLQARAALSQLKGKQ